MKLWIVEYATGPFDAATMAVEANEYALAFKLSISEGQVATFDYETENRGLSFTLGLVAPMRVIAAWSPTGLPEDARTLAVGFVVEAPGNLFSESSTLQVRCAPVDFDGQILAWAKVNLASGPETDLRFDDDPEETETYVVGRCVDYHVDPVTHTISVSDSLIGDRVVDLSAEIDENAGLNATAGSFGDPQPVLTAEFEAAWTQEAKGTVDIAGAILPFETMDGDPFSILENPSTVDDVAGIDFVSGGIRAAVSHAYLETIRIDGFEAVYDTQALAQKLVDAESTIVPIDQANDGDRGFKYEFRKAASWEPLSLETFLEDETQDIPENADFDQSQIRFPTTCDVSYEVSRVRVLDYLVSWEASQARVEKLVAKMRFPVPETYKAEKPEVLTVGLRDEFIDPPATEYTGGVTYETGDIVTSGTGRFKATRQIIDSPTILLLSDGWERYRTTEGRVTVLRTEEAADMQRHILCRLLREGRRRLRSVNLQFQVRWTAASDLSVRDAVSISVPWSTTEDRTVVGKVISVEMTWNGDGEAVGSVTIGVCAYGTYEGGAGTIDDVTTALIGPGSAASTSDLDDLGDRIALLRAGAYQGLVRSASIRNGAGVQRGVMTDLAAAGLDPSTAPVRRPTRLEISFAPLGREDEIVSEYEIFAQLNQAPRGFA